VPDTKALTPNRYSSGTLMKLQELFEMAAPSTAHKTATYFHGTSSEPAGESILQSGIKPGDVVVQKKTVKGPSLEPVKGKVYVTSDLKYAQIYAIGGDMAGTDSPRNKGFGYLFVIDGSELSDIQPDEDSVGEMIYYALKGERKEPILQRYVSILTRSLTAGQLKKFKDAEYVMWAHAGKKLLKSMSDADKLAFIDAGSHIANTGEINFKEAWRIDKSKIKNLKKDGSNFFEIAERVK
jgi:hypothetical protein